ncbi:MAG: hypothetical protein JWM95_5519 [Gemmatimonadetes bacterium]|nr:hypothetical protein [Gemmatimonadota bacterium]
MADTRKSPRGSNLGRRGRAYVGISGYDYKPWHGVFYPAELARRRWLEYAAGRFNSIELNGTFYSLKSPTLFARWMSEVRSEEFVFAIKGSRFITHNLKLRNSTHALGNFFSSGILALGRMTGPFLWQLPATYAFDAERMETFMRMLPWSSREGEQVAAHHDHRIRFEPLLHAPEDVVYRHAFEVRHESYFCDEFYDLLRANQCAFVVADTAGTFPYAEEVTSDFVYIRLHGSQQLYVSGYSDDELDTWATKIRRWLRSGRDVYVYFDNDAKVHAPFDAERLAKRMRSALQVSSDARRVR